MQTGTVILLARMKTNPEEFFGSGSHRWDRIINDVKPYLPTEDAYALEEGVRQLHVDRFNERVLKQIAGEEDSSLFSPSPFGAVLGASSTITAGEIRNAILRTSSSS